MARSKRSTPKVGKGNDAPSPAHEPTRAEVERVALAARDLVNALRRAEMSDYPAHLARHEVATLEDGLRRALCPMVEPRTSARIRVQPVRSPDPWPPFHVAGHLLALDKHDRKVAAWLERWNRSGKRPPTPKGLVAALEGSAADLARAVEGAEVEEYKPEWCAPMTLVTMMALLDVKYDQRVFVKMATEEYGLRRVAETQRLYTLQVDLLPAAYQDRFRPAK